MVLPTVTEPLGPGLRSRPIPPSTMSGQPCLFGMRSTPLCSGCKAHIPTTGLITRRSWVMYLTAPMAFGRMSRRRLDQRRKLAIRAYRFGQIGDRRFQHAERLRYGLRATKRPANAWNLWSSATPTRQRREIGCSIPAAAERITLENLGPARPTDHRPKSNCHHQRSSSRNARLGRQGQRHTHSRRSQYLWRRHDHLRGKHPSSRRWRRIACRGHNHQ